MIPVMGALDDARCLLQAKNYSGSGDWLDESSGGTHDGTFNGGVESTFDGSSFYFDGVSGGGDYITIGGTKLDASGSFTVAIVVDIPTGEPDGNTVLAANKASLGGSQGWAIWGSSLASINGRVHDGTTGFDVAFPTGSNDTADLYVLRREATGDTEWTGWVDGTADTGTPDTLGDCTSTSTHRIGAEGGGFNNFGGYVYAYADWERALTDAEIVGLFDEFYPGGSGLSAYGAADEYYGASSDVYGATASTGGNRMGGTGAIRQHPRPATRPPR